jgi:hypothetical protein
VQTLDTSKCVDGSAGGGAPFCCAPAITEMACATDWYPVALATTDEGLLMCGTGLVPYTCQQIGASPPQSIYGNNFSAV